MIRVLTHCHLGTAEPAVADALRDPKLGRLEATLMRGGLRSAIQRYSSEPSPQLIIAEVDPDLAAPEALLSAVAAFSEVCDVGSNLILLGGVNDIDLYRALRRQGVADYIRLPLDHAQFRDSIRGLFENYAGAHLGRSIAVIGAKGGCGASTVAQGLAWLLSRGAGSTAMLLDLDLSFGASDFRFGLEATDGARSLLKDMKPIDQATLDRFAVRYDERLQLLGTSASLDLDGMVDPDRLEALFDALARHCRWGVMDLPHAWNRWVQRGLRLADAVVVVSPLDLTAVRNCRNLLDWLGRERPGGRPPLVALTGSGRKGGLAEKDFCTSLGIKDPVLLPDDRAALLAALAAGKSLPEAAPKSPLTAGLKRLAAALDTSPGALAPGSRGLLDRLLPRLTAGRR